MVDYIINLLDDVVQINNDKKEVFISTKSIALSISVVNKHLRVKGRSYKLIPFDSQKHKIIIR
jgi:hypothetical protein